MKLVNMYDNDLWYQNKIYCYIIRVNLYGVDIVHDRNEIVHNVDNNSIVFTLGLWKIIYMEIYQINYNELK